MLQTVVAWTCLTVAVIANYGAFWEGGVFLLVLAALLLYQPLRKNRLSTDGLTADKALGSIARIGSTLALALSLASLWRGGDDPPKYGAVLISAQVIALLVAWSYVLPDRLAPELLRRSRVVMMLVAVGVQGLVAIAAMPDPYIDVFYFLNEGARGFLQGMNPYAMSFTPLPAWISAGYQDPAYHFDVYAYLPGTLLLTLPGAVGDVRFVMLGAVLAAAILLQRMAAQTGASAERARLAAVAFLAYPGLVHIIQHAWVEPLIVVVWLVGVSVHLAHVRAPIRAALVALLLLTKQFTAALLLPMMSVGLRWRGIAVGLLGALFLLVPFVLWDSSAFLWDAVYYQMRAPSRADALSLNGFLLNHGLGDMPAVLSLGIPLLAALWAMLALLSRRPLAEVMRRTAGLYLLTFLFGKFAFANYYFLTQAILVASVAVPAAFQLSARATKVSSSADPEREDTSALASRAAGTERPRVLVFIVAYNAARTIEWVLGRIPRELEQFDTEVLVIDDASKDGTFDVAERFRRRHKFPFPLTILANPVNQGYGGNQKLGFQYAIEHDFDAVALVHGDGQYAPELLPTLVAPILNGDADAVFGSRMMDVTGALKGGMPAYKYAGNRVLTFVQNRLLGTRLSEFHSGYRLYAVDMLKKIPFELNSNVFHFDTEIIIQLVLRHGHIKELPIPTYYGDEVCHVNGLRYACDVLRASLAARLQALNLLYRRNFDVAPDGQQNHYYVSKLSYPSTHQAALAEIVPGETVLDVGCAGGFLAGELALAGCKVIGVDRFPPQTLCDMDAFYRRDLDTQPLPQQARGADVVVLLDVIEHLRSPEKFLEHLRDFLADSPHSRVILSTGNVGFIVTRMMLLLGQFNYGKRGILDITHTRLFTFGSLARAFNECGFEITNVRGIPAPIPEVVRHPVLADGLMRINKWLISISRTLFAYQIFIVAQPLPTVETLLRRSEAHTGDLCAVLEPFRVAPAATSHQLSARLPLPSRRRYEGVAAGRKAS